MSSVADNATPVVLGVRRITAAFVAVAFPVFGFGTIFAGFIRNGFDIQSLLEHPVFLVTLLPGLAALSLWCLRYWNPALDAFRHPTPVVADGGCLHVNARQFPITEHLMIDYDNRSKILVRNGETVLAEIPSFFIRIRPPRD